MTRQSGFTLVELAIALMVIGLLIGGVLKGQELIENARVTAFARQIKAYDAAVLIFKSTYGSLPGDIKKPNRIPNCDTALCNIPGNGNGKILDTDTSPTYVEQFNFFPHLTKAGLIKGPEGGTVANMNAVTSDWQNEAGDLFFPTIPIDSPEFFRVIYPDGINAYYYTAVTGRLAMTLDSKLDDGKPYAELSVPSGDVFPEAGGDCEDQDSVTEYNIDSPFCALVIRTGF